MLKLCFIFMLNLNLAVAFIDPKIGGTINLNPSLKIKDSKNNFLIVEASKVSDGSVIARLKIFNVKFPQAFVITPKNVLNENLYFAEKMKIVAQLYLEGNEHKLKGIDKNFPIAELGKKDLNIEIDQENDKR